MPAMVRWEPQRDLWDIQRSLSRLLDVGRVDGELGSGFATDVYETPDDVLVTADLPGIPLKDITVQFHGGQLSIRASRKLEGPQGASELRLERASGEFVRTFAVAAPIQPEAIEASYRDGVLTIRLPKAEEARPRQIPVKVVAAH